jgi:hypothetical protein
MLCARTVSSSWLKGSPSDAVSRSASNMITFFVCRTQLASQAPKLALFTHRLADKPKSTTQLNSAAPDPIYDLICKRKSNARIPSHSFSILCH